MTWEAPGSRADAVDGPGDRHRPPVPVHWWKGSEHRCLIVPSELTDHPDNEKVGMFFRNSLAVLVAPLWLPSCAVLQPWQTSKDK